MIKGLVSVIMPTYNCGRFITETIRSIQAQTYDNWQIEIVDDCSTDDTKAIVEELMAQDDRIHYHCLETNSGAAVARTEAMKLAQGEYMAFCDSDDLWMPEKLERQLKFMNDNGYAFSCTAYEQIDEQSNSLDRVIKTVKKTDYNRLLRNIMVYHNCLSPFLCYSV